MKKILTGAVITLALFLLMAAATRINLATQSIVGGTNYGVVYQSASGIPQTTVAGASGNVLTSTATGAPVYLPAVGATLSANQTFTGINAFSNASSTFAGKATTATTAGDLTGTPNFFSPITNALASDVTSMSLGAWYDGPSIAQGTSGGWFVTGFIALGNSSAASQFYVKLWDGTTVIAAGYSRMYTLGSNVTVALSGYINNPSGNLRMSAEDATDSTGYILHTVGVSGNDASHITAIRVH